LPELRVLRWPSLIYATKPGRRQRRGNAIQIGLFHSMFKLLANQQELFGDAFGVCCLGFFEINRETS
ncbi:hypothetical protein, partial [Massilia timonae]|uniref:hypothetical protein n=1 Tax=Massilia timonae TaxID=47229 RepID=UPI00289D3932